jgi:hypothetical protein
MERKLIHPNTGFVPTHRTGATGKRVIGFLISFFFLLLTYSSKVVAGFVIFQTLPMQVFQNGTLLSGIDIWQVYCEKPKYCTISAARLSCDEQGNLQVGATANESYSIGYHSLQVLHWNEKHLKLRQKDGAKYTNCDFQLKKATGTTERIEDGLCSNRATAPFVGEFTYKPRKERLNVAQICKNMTIEGTIPNPTSIDEGSRLDCHAIVNGIFGSGRNGAIVSSEVCHGAQTTGELHDCLVEITKLFQNGQNGAIAAGVCSNNPWNDKLQKCVLEAVSLYGNGSNGSIVARNCGRKNL